MPHMSGMVTDVSEGSGGGSFALQMANGDTIAFTLDYFRTLIDGRRPGFTPDLKEGHRATVFYTTDGSRRRTAVKVIVDKVYCVNSPKGCF